MSWWIIQEHRHHSVEVDDIFHNIKAETEEEAILEAYKAVMRNMYHDDIQVPDISDILVKDELVVKATDLEFGDDDVMFVIWNKSDGQNQNMGIGHGDDIRYTDKSDNRWISVEPRTNENLHLALKGYDHKFQDLPSDLIQQILQTIEE